MKVALVAAPLLFRRCPLIGLGYLTSYLRAHSHEVSLFDANVAAPIPRDDDESAWLDRGFVEGFITENRALISGWVSQILSCDPGVVGFSLWHSNRFVSFEMAARIKREKPDCLIVFGGPHVNFEQKALFACPGVDVLVLGEGEETLLDIVSRRERGEGVEGVPGTLSRGNGRVLRADIRPEIADLDSLPYPDYRDFRRERYLLSTTLPLSFNRGCLRRCAFCNVHSDWKSYRHRCARSIYREIETMLRDFPETQHFEIDVAALNQDVRRLSDICDRILTGGHRFGWGGQAFIRPEMTGALIKKMARAGCRHLNYGLEYGSQPVLDRMKKGFLVDHAQRCIREAHEAGIKVSLNVIIGFPGETEEDLRRTMDFLKRNKEFIDFVGCPSELTINAHTLLHDFPERFGVRPGPSAVGTEWESEGNTHSLRRERIRRFSEFLKVEAIGEFGPYRRVKTVTGHGFSGDPFSSSRP